MCFISKNFLNLKHKHLIVITATNEHLAIMLNRKFSTWNMENHLDASASN